MNNTNTTHTIDHCLILSAGLGTRMGPIGKVLPKVLWPVFEKKLLELQLAYAACFGVKHVYMNIYHLYEQVQSFVHQSNLEDSISLIHEKDLLDIGGAIHNLARLPHVNYQGNLLVINCDQFLFFDFSIIKDLLPKLKENVAVLLMNNVPGNLGYNSTRVDKDHRLVEIIPGKKQDTLIPTYAGVGLINLSELKPASGASRFFDMVANYKQDPVLMHEIPEYEYWDFGTLERYELSMFSLLQKMINEEVTPFVEFCRRQKVLIPQKINPSLSSYGKASSANMINLSSFLECGQTDQKSMILKSSKKHASSLAPGIYYEDMFDVLPIP